MWKYEVEQRRTERVQDKSKNINRTTCTEDDQYEQQIIVKGNMISYIDKYPY